MKNILTLLLLSLITLYNASAQTQTEYCRCKAAEPYVTKHFKHHKKAYALTAYSTNEITVSIINPTQDTTFLFSSYLQPDFYNSPYLHRVKLKTQMYKVSFLPIVSHLFVKYADNITGNPIMGQNQIVYDFIKLPPHSKQEITFSLEKLFNNPNENEVTSDYNVKRLNKYSKTIPSRTHKIDLQKKHFHFQFEFAIYKSVSLLCNQEDFYTKEFEFDRQSKNFTILTVPFKYGNVVKNSW